MNWTLPKGLRASIHDKSIFRDQKKMAFPLRFCSVLCSISHRCNNDAPDQSWASSLLSAPRRTFHLREIRVLYLSYRAEPSSCFLSPTRPERFPSPSPPLSPGFCNEVPFSPVIIWLAKPKWGEMEKPFPKEVRELGRSALRTNSACEVSAFNKAWYD